MTPPFVPQLKHSEDTTNFPEITVSLGGPIRPILMAGPILVAGPIFLPSSEGLLLLLLARLVGIAGKPLCKSLIPCMAVLQDGRRIETFTPAKQFTGNQLPFIGFTYQREPLLESESKSPQSSLSFDCLVFSHPFLSLSVKIRRGWNLERTGKSPAPPPDSADVFDEFDLISPGRHPGNDQAHHGTGRSQS